MNGIFYGWWIVLATGLIHCWGAGTFFYSFTAFFNPIVNEFGWSYAATSFAASLRSIEAGIASPAVGFAADRFGPRRLLLIGSVLSGLGFILFSQINSLWTFYVTFIFLSIGSSLLFPVPGWTSVTNWFVKKRGTAIGLVSAAIGMGGVLVYLVNWLIGAYGWRTTLIIIGVGMWVVGIPGALVVRHRPEPYGLFPDGERPSESEPDDPEKIRVAQTELPGDFTLIQALKTRAFWVIAITMTISGAAVHAVTVHIMPHLINVRFDREAASLVASLFVLVSVAGRFGLGWLGNRIDKRYVIAFGLVLQTMGLLFLARARTLWDAIMFVILYGPGYGGLITLRLTIQADYFGRKAFGSIQGVSMAIIVLGTMTSPLLTGLVYDLYGTYVPAWITMAGVILASIPLALMTRPPRARGKNAQ